MSRGIVITGAGTGTGRLAARSLALAGRTVYVSMRGRGSRNAGKATEARTLADEHTAPVSAPYGRARGGMT
jgi:NAD(P)-dependent dehydrogenase (short-subunit alcohol dehydrogenase family)